MEWLPKCNGDRGFFNSRTLGSLDKFLFKRNNLVTANYDEVSNKIFSSIFPNSLKNFSIFKIIESIYKKYYDKILWGKNYVYIVYICEFGKKQVTTYENKTCSGIIWVYDLSSIRE